MSDQTPLLELRDVNTYYGQIHILQGVSLAIRPGELVSLLGGNASGKSTTLKTILGIVEPRTGSVIFDFLLALYDNRFGRVLPWRFMKDG